jgi:hypothetical protein
VALRVTFLRDSPLRGQSLKGRFVNCLVCSSV